MPTIPEQPENRPGPAAAALNQAIQETSDKLTTFKDWLAKNPKPDEIQLENFVTGLVQGVDQVKQRFEDAKDVKAKTELDQKLQIAVLRQVEELVASKDAQERIAPHQQPIVADVLDRFKGRLGQIRDYLRTQGIDLDKFDT